jgi:hypothetical protein
VDSEMMVSKGLTRDQNHRDCHIHAFLGMHVLFMGRPWFISFLYLDMGAWATTSWISQQRVDEIEIFSIIFRAK